MGILRVLLAILVVGSHTSPFFGLKLPSGYYAVEAFFLISGFYMASILNEKYFAHKGGYKLFISNRFLRIYPLYYILLVIIIIYSAIRELLNAPNIFTIYQYAHLSFASIGFFIITNVTIFGQDLTNFLGIHSGGLYWTSNFIETPEPELTHYC
jgi:peptidoglycan/LPS O-acetylase OafA/YrhL